MIEYSTNFKHLINLSIIEKTNNKYIIADPIIRKAVEELIS